MRVYMDTSVVMRRVLGQPGAITDWSGWEPAVSVELIRVEAHRIIDRLRLRDRLTDPEVMELRASVQKMIRGFEILPLSRAVLNRAADPFPTALGTLDAIHLASALLWMEERDEAITFLTHDTQLAIAATACGLDVKTAAF
jgi:predicted nucleic acid-binding protein